MAGRFIVHPSAVCETEDVGGGTRIGAFAHVGKGASIGRDVEIGEHAFVDQGVGLGDGVVVGSGARISGPVRIEAGVRIGAGAVFTDERESSEPGEASGETRVSRGASIGANATVLGGATIGRNAAIGAGAVISRSVPPNAIVMGNPGRIRGYVDAESRGLQPAELPAPPDEDERVHRSRVRDVRFHRLPLKHDLRGSLTVGEVPRDVPFQPRRYFLVFDVPGSEIRGEHAHRRCELFLVCVRGAVSVVVDDGEAREEFRLDHPTLGVYLPPMVWGTQYKHTSDAVLLVFASDHYDPDDYIRDYDAFLREVGRSRA